MSIDSESFIDKEPSRLYATAHDRAGLGSRAYAARSGRGSFNFDWRPGLGFLLAFRAGLEKLAAFNRHPRRKTESNFAPSALL
jgi:hypothetical protein